MSQIFAKKMWKYNLVCYITCKTDQDIGHWFAASRLELETDCPQKSSKSVTKTERNNENDGEKEN